MGKIGILRCWRTLCGVLALCASAEAQAQPAADENEGAAGSLLEQNSFQGPTGGFRIVDAGSGRQGTFRLALYTEFFLIRDFIVPDDLERYYAANLSLSVTPLPFLEVFASAQVSSSWNEAGDPELIQVVADTLLGVKGFHWIRPWIAVGGDASILFPGGIGDTRRTFSATSVGLRGNATLDLRSFGRRSIPLIARFNAQYWFDNTAELVEDVENDRLERSNEAQLFGQSHLINAIERFGYEVNRVDSVRLGIGGEAPLRVGRVGLHPLLEWRWFIPVNRQGFECQLLTAPSVRGAESCLADEKARAFPMTLTGGVRVFPPLDGLAFHVGVDVGLTGSRRPFVRELAPTAPYQILIGAAYAFDPIERAETPAPPAAPQSAEADSDEQPEPSIAVQPLPAGGRARIVVNTVDETDRPLPIVPVVVHGPTVHRLVSDSEGRAILEAIPPGRYTASVDEEGYLMSILEIDVGAGQERSETLRLVPRPNRPGVVLRRGRLELSEEVSFRTGSAQIPPKSESILFEVADVLLRNPDLELIEIQGHTDSLGNRQVNLEISQKRAQAVALWLVGRGVDPERLVAKGYGSTRPLAPNITSHNRARNRRVQFKIERRAADATVDDPAR